jgi:uncharacterized pyridoxamine 5'-phosphate oxidase family protein
MHETDDELGTLQELLDRSHGRMNPHMRSILTAERRLSARQVVTYLDGVKHVALATIDAAGAPRVAPMDALFVHGRFHLGTGGSAARVAHLARRPAVSLTHFAADDIALTVHGTATLMRRDHPEAARVEPVFVAAYGSSPFGWAEDVVLIRVEPTWMSAYAPDPARYPDGAAPPRPSRPMRLVVPARKTER